MYFAVIQHRCWLLSTAGCPTDHGCPAFEFGGQPDGIDRVQCLRDACVVADKQPVCVDPGALRAMLRQDPNIIMVGEIRDTETAQLATEAALTGHLVLSTLHTNDALTAIPRLTNMGVEPYLVAATLRGVIAQRLVKRLCSSCTAPAPLNDAERTFLQSMEFDPTDAVFAKGSGCQRCDHRGTRGRIGVFELVTLTEMMTSNVIRSLGQEQAAIQSVGSSRTFWNDGIAKALAHEIPLIALMQILSTTTTQPLPTQSATRFAA